MMMKGWALVNWYYLCKGEKELVNHILIHCSLACTLWHLLCSFFGLSWNPPRLVKEVSLGWHGGWEKCRKAARYDDIDDVKIIASAGVSLDSKDSQGRTGYNLQYVLDIPNTVTCSLIINHGQ
ncbi:hypothetical protein CK203_004507 [Vitis vinifera]|uniref:Uncharacterized protein n=1 Tax=Vitis vinifera TaxID=29760 RepID=A0A438KFV8_VITVI|nr:hypothetical protein CK203_004507 [Vitis vinifera]